MAIDYSDRNNWLKFDYDNPDKAGTQVDVIFINGTVIDEANQKNGIAFICEKMKSEFRNGYSGNADVFDDGVRMYIPYYRQIALLHILTHSNSQTSLPEMMKNSEAAEDIMAFMDYYFQKCNDGRPFIIAGLSQGGAAVQIVLEKYFGEKEHRKYLQNMIAAYSIAYGVDKNWLTQLEYVKFAEGPTDTGVLISWITEGVGKKDFDLLIPHNPDDSLIINPINWKTDDTYASANENLGTFVNGKIITPGIYSLQLDPKRGCLICENNTDYLPEGLFGGKSLHMHEIDQAYGSIRKNMHDRIDSFFSKHKH